VARPGLIPLLAVTGLAIGLTILAALQLLILQPVLPAGAIGAGAAAIVSLALAVGLRRPRIIAATEVALLLLYVLVLVGRSASSLASASAPIIAGSVFLTAQLGWWAIELRTPVHEATPALWNRAGQIGASSLGAALVAELIWQATRIHPGRGIAFLTIGLLAAIGMAALYLRITTQQKAAPSARFSQPSFQPRSGHFRSRRPSTATRHVVFGAVGSVVRPADAHAPWRSRHSVLAQTWVALVLLVLDAGFTLAAIGSSVHFKSAEGIQYESFVGKVNAAPAIALGLIGAAAIILAWLVLYLRSSVSPLGTTINRPVEDAPPISTVDDLETIRVMCQRAWNSGKPDLELVRFLDSVGKGLSDNSGASASRDTSPPTSLAEIESIVEQMERVTDA
jgi:hypothetical protein